MLDDVRVVVRVEQDNAPMLVAAYMKESQASEQSTKVRLRYLRIGRMQGLYAAIDLQSILSGAPVSRKPLEHVFNKPVGIACFFRHDRCPRLLMVNTVISISLDLIQSTVTSVDDVVEILTLVYFQNWNDKRILIYMFN